MAEYTTEPGLYGNLISQNRSGVESQYHFDALGSTLALTDDNQQVTDVYAYTAFGEVTEHTGSTVDPFQYIGQKGYYRDDEAGECWRRPRVLSPKVERWLTSDTTAYTEGSNGYSYASNNPTSLVDPSGNMARRLSRPLFSFSLST
jgi:RHS repeat-associated protein